MNGNSIAIISTGASYVRVTGNPGIIRKYTYFQPAFIKIMLDTHPLLIHLYHISISRLNIPVQIQIIAATIPRSTYLYLINPKGLFPSNIEIMSTGIKINISVV